MLLLLLPVLAMMPWGAFKGRAERALSAQIGAPMMIGAMTGATERTGQINGVLARAGAGVGVAMALGSQRPMLVHPETRASFAVRDMAPDLPLLVGNVGAVQLNYGVTAAQIGGLARDVGAEPVSDKHLGRRRTAFAADEFADGR